MYGSFSGKTDAAGNGARKHGCRESHKALNTDEAAEGRRGKEVWRGAETFIVRHAVNLVRSTIRGSKTREDDPGKKGSNRDECCCVWSLDIICSGLMLHVHDVALLGNAI